MSIVQKKVNLKCFLPSKPIQFYSLAHAAEFPSPPTVMDVNIK